MKQIYTKKKRKTYDFVAWCHLMLVKKISMTDILLTDIFKFKI